MSATALTQQLETRIRQELPSLIAEQAVELADIVGQLMTLWRPERIYAFESRARDDAHVHDRGTPFALTEPNIRRLFAGNAERVTSVTRMRKRCIRAVVLHKKGC